MVLGYVDFIIEKYADPRTKRYFLMSSIWHPLILIATYLVFVNRIGPWFMKNRKPFNMKNIIMIFDVAQVIANAYLVIQLVIRFPPINSNFCMEVDYKEDTHLKIAYIYFTLKVSDMLDTIFFVLKKNYAQVSFLHVYHHSLMIIFSWIAVKFVGGGLTAITGLANSFVHVVMYSYYFLSAYDVKYKNTFIKKFVTQVQIIQFLLLFLIHFPYLFISCQYPKSITGFGVIQAGYFFYLFSNFYYKTYIKPSKLGKVK
ncbi:hypothetical protein HHI36_012007 [Cryptolaemus montrouzieri]|uniref:Elongation of very long chain fatty acids protein n=1 Tax=Cryptolaemus montrouzieri TaxID=559131 RepID=A0ABD2NDW2_9CUCU